MLFISSPLTVVLVKFGQLVWRKVGHHPAASKTGVTSTCVVDSCRLRTLGKRMSVMFIILLLSPRYEVLKVSLLYSVLNYMFSTDFTIPYVICKL